LARCSRIIFGVLTTFAAAGLVVCLVGWPRVRSILKRFQRKRTVAEVVAEIGPEMANRWREVLTPAGIDWPPPGVALLALKEEKRLEVWARHGNRWLRIRDYPVLAASGGPGPKLRQGDQQVPEGVYRIVGLNPNSSYHLSMKLNYPNAADLQRAERDGRTNLGGDIFIHGRAVSIGCLAMGDAAIEELFVLVHAVGLPSVKVVIVPNDLRQDRPIHRAEDDAPWVDDLYGELRREIAAFTD